MARRSGTRIVGRGRIRFYNAPQGKTKHACVHIDHFLLLHFFSFYGLKRNNTNSMVILTVGLTIRDIFKHFFSSFLFFFFFFFFSFLFFVLMQNTVSVEKLRLQDPYIKISGFSEEVGVSVSFFFILFFSSRRALNVYGGIADTRVKVSKNRQEKRKTTGNEK